MVMAWWSGRAFRSFCIAEAGLAYRDWIVALLLAMVLAAGAAAQGAPAPASAAASGARMVPLAPHWVPVARAAGRLRAAQLGLVVNTADPYSVQVGEYYAARRRLAPEQILRVELPVRAVLDVPEFDALRQAIADRFGSNIQALALAWSAPYAVGCNSITGALALGYDAELCKHTCTSSRASPYFNAASARPFTELGLRPSMLLAAANVAQARALVDRGIAADGSLLVRGRPPANALFLASDDAARRVRRQVYPPAGLVRAPNVDVRVAPAEALRDTPRVLLAVTGAAKLDLPPVDWLPGALADHLTSFGGALQGQHGQSTVLDWIASGATASYGTVTEPCNHLQKFPHPQMLLLHYLQGETAIEAYWKSVAWPQQGLFVGEPLAAPFSR
jgi:uncharacterized protein (TIGR03790 family)